MVNDTNSALLNSDRLTATGIPSSQFEDPNLLGISPRASSLISPVTSRLAALSTPADVDIEAIGANWVAQGPAPINTTISSGGTVTINPNNQVAGAIRTVIVNPNDPNTLWVGTVNGGIWRTNTANQATPTWTPLTDEFRGLSIGAMDLDSTNLDSQGNPRTIVAGVGHFSSYYGFGGALTGLLLSTDGGNTFREIRDSSGNPLLQNTNISGVVMRGNTILAATTDSGVFRLVSNDNGATWSSVGTNGIPAGVAFDLVADSANNFYVAIQGVGIFLSEINSNGANWVNVSAPDPTLGADNGNGTNGNGRNAIHTAIIPGTDFNRNTKMTVAANGRIYVGVVRGTNGHDSRPVYIGFSDNRGATWIPMNLPVIALQTGGQGDVHFSILADPDNPDIVYLGGDVDPRLRGTTSISGNTATTVWQNLSGTGGTASNSSPHADSRDMVFTRAPVVDVNGNPVNDPNGNPILEDVLIEVDDGGIYRRTSPKDNTGNWFSLNGNLQITEQYDIVYDTTFNVLISGNQDNGTTLQQTALTTTTSQPWSRLYGGDGNVAIWSDPNNPIVQAVRYYSSANLKLNDSGFGLVRDSYVNLPVIDSNILVSSNVGLTGFGVDTNIDGTIDNAERVAESQYRTPLATNPFDSNRLIVGGGTRVFESKDRGDSVNVVANVGVNSNYGNAIAYGGWERDNAGVLQPRADVLYVGSGKDVYVRPTTGGNLVQRSIRDASGNPLVDTGGNDLTFLRGFNGNYILDNSGNRSNDDVRGIVLDNRNWQTAFTIDQDNVFQTTDAGVSWRDITGDLFSRDRFNNLDLNRFANPLGIGDYLVSIEFVPTLDALVVGTTQGVFASLSNNWSDWFAVGPATQPNAAQTRLPHVPVWDMDFVNAIPNAPNGLLAVGTLGRGAWTINNINTVLNSAPRPNGGSSYDVNEGSSVMLDASGSSDPNGLALTYTWDLDGDGIFGETGLNAIRGAEVGINPTFSAAELNGFEGSQRIVKLRVTNSEGSSAVDKNIRIDIKNVAPTINGFTLSSTVINENNSITLSGSFIDPGILDTHKVTINWGDGTTSEIRGTQIVQQLDKVTRTFQLSHQYLDDSPSGTPSDLLPITVTVDDFDGGIAQASTAVRVNNIAPVITSFTSNANFADRARINKPVNINATFTDIGTLDTHRAFVDWGDGTPTQEVSILQSRGYGTVQGSHIYAKGGAFKVKLTLNDDDIGEEDEFTRAIIIGTVSGPG